MLSLLTLLFLEKEEEFFFYLFLVYSSKILRHCIGMNEWEEEEVVYFLFYLV